MSAFMDSSSCLVNLNTCSPIEGMFLIRLLISAFMRVTLWPVMILLRYDESAPTFGEMDISLSFRIIMKFFSRSPTQLSPSNAIPAVMEPSPITATTLAFSPLRHLASAIPAPAEIDVLLCPTLNTSYGLSSRRGKPHTPPLRRRVLKISLRPVMILWA